MGGDEEVMVLRGKDKGKGGKVKNVVCWGKVIVEENGVGEDRGVERMGREKVEMEDVDG